MANGTVDFFGTSSLTVPNVGTCWEFQNGGAIQHAKTRASELGKDGDELTSGFHDEKSTTSFTYVFKQPATAVTNYSWPKVGQVLSGWHIDGFSCAWSRDRKAAVLTVNAHKHDASTHDTATHTYTPSLSAIAVATFGVPSSFGTAFALDANAVVDLRSATYAVQCNHVDEQKRDGTHLKGDNYDGTETLAVELTGAATSDDYTSTWDMPSDTTTPSNTGATTTSLNFEHHLSHDAD